MKKSFLHKIWHIFASPNEQISTKTTPPLAKTHTKNLQRIPMAEISIICKCTVVSTKPAPPGKFIPLSILDRVMENNHIILVFYYQYPLGKTPGELIEKLRESMAEMLSSYPIATGRLLRNSEGNWMVKCNDAGLRMVEAKAKGSVHEWLQSVDREKEMKLVHWEEMFHKTYFWATFYVQITEFECGGVSIGLSCTHLLSDPKSAAALIKSWADVTLAGKIKSPPLFHPLPTSTTTHNPHSQLINHYKSTITNTHTKQTTITLQFDHETVKNFISMAGTLITPFTALAALFWTRVSKVKGKKGSLVNMSICLDARKLMGLEERYFGNCMVYNEVDGVEINENDIGKAANSIQESILKMGFGGVLDLIEWLDKEELENVRAMDGCDLICADFGDLDSYNVVFEDDVGPVQFSSYVAPCVGPGRVLILPGPEGEFGRVVMVTLPEDEVEKLLEDELILRFYSKVLMGLNRKLS